MSFFIESSTDFFVTRYGPYRSLDEAKMANSILKLMNDDGVICEFAPLPDVYVRNKETQRVHGPLQLANAAELVQNQTHEAVRVIFP